MPSGETVTQLLIDLGPPPAPTFANFVVGPNGAAVEALKRLCDAPVDDAAARGLYLWGAHASGRTHLLSAAVAQTSGTHLAGSAATAGAIRLASEPDRARARWLLAIDDVEDLDADAQEALFHAHNAMRQDARGAIVVAGRASPRDVALAPGREDLRSRLAWGLAFQLHRLDDAATEAALARRAADAGFPLSTDVLRYLMTHFARDLGTLVRTLDALDRHAREQRRVVTVPMVRDFVQRPIDFTSPPSGSVDHAA